MTAYEWGWLTAVLLTCIVDYALWKRVGASATLSHLIWRVGAFGEEGRQKRFWRVRRCALGLALVILLAHFLDGGGWLVI